VRGVSVAAEDRRTGYPKSLVDIGASVFPDQPFQVAEQPPEWFRVVGRSRGKTVNQHARVAQRRLEKSPVLELKEPASQRVAAAFQDSRT